ncbi:MAG: GntR family transcriptional regulator [Saccharofermentanales bacterium]|jgi:GntR family transcriptional regulator
MKIDKRSTIPLYAQLKELLSERIADGTWQRGEQIPSELALCEELDLSRPTVRQAIAELVNEGLLIIHKGRGTFVASEPERIDLKSYSAFYFSILSARSITDFPLDSIEQVPADPELDRVFGAGSDQGVGYWQINYTLDLDGLPYAACRVHIPMIMFPELGPDLRAGKRMVDITANKYAYLPQKAQSSLIQRPSAREEAQQLDISRGTPILIHNSRLISRSGAICESVTALLRPDMLILSFEGGRS